MGAQTRGVRGRVLPAVRSHVAREPRTLEEARDVIADLQERVRELSGTNEVAHWALWLRMQPNIALLLISLFRAYPNVVTHTRLWAAFEERRRQRGKREDIDYMQTTRTFVYRAKRWLKAAGVERGIVATVGGYMLTPEAWDLLRGRIECPPQT